MRAIVAICEDGGIGYRGHLLIHNKDDMRRFVHLTTGATVVMGQKTFDSLPGGRPLKNRRNIVLTLKEGFVRSGIEVAHTTGEVLDLIASEDPNRVWLIGGASAYRSLLPYCSAVCVTKNCCIRKADSFFPNLDEDPCWVLTSKEPGGTTPEGICFFYLTYTRRDSALVAKENPTTR